MNEHIQHYRVEVNTNFCFYVDVYANNTTEAKELAYNRAYEKSETLVGTGDDEEDMVYGIAQPEIGLVTNENGDEIVSEKNDE